MTSDGMDEVGGWWVIEVSDSSRLKSGPSKLLDWVPYP